VLVVRRKKQTSVMNLFSYFNLLSYDRLCIYIHTLQSQCNPDLNYIEQYKEICHDSSILQESNQT